MTNVKCNLQIEFKERCHVRTRYTEAMPRQLQWTTSQKVSIWLVTAAHEDLS